MKSRTGVFSRVARMSAFLIRGAESQPTPLPDEKKHFIRATLLSSVQALDLGYFLTASGLKRVLKFVTIRQSRASFAGLSGVSVEVASSSRARFFPRFS